MKFENGQMQVKFHLPVFLRSEDMSLTRTKSKQKRKQTRTPITWKEIKRQKVLLFWAGVMMIYGVIFYYLPLAGWAMAFQNYKPRTGILHSEFVGLEKFRMLFSDMTFIRVIRNTLAMGGYIFYSNCICCFTKRNQIKRWKESRTDNFLPSTFPFLDYCNRYFT